MAVALLEENPVMTSELYDQVRQRLDLENNPAAGLIFHAGVGLGSWVAYDVWESRAAWYRFLEERLQPAVEEGLQRRGTGARLRRIDRSYSSFTRCWWTCPAPETAECHDEGQV